MPLFWSQPAIDDLERVYHFLLRVNPQAAAGVVQSLVTASKNLITHPRRGPALVEFQPREVRRLICGHYEIRYECQNTTLYILRVWHTREHRSREADSER